MFDLSDLRRAVHYEGGVSRRLFLAYGAALAALPSLASRSEAAVRRPRFSSDPFTLGVASGDPDASSVVLWTRLAPQPLEPFGGMKAVPVSVQWEIAHDEAFQKVIAQGNATATPQLAHSVHVEVGNLQPDRWYWYRFRAGDATSPTGRTRTLPSAHSTPEKLRFAFASCQHYEQGYYTAYEQMARDELDLVFHLGDYIYEYPGAEGKVRKHTGPAKTKIQSLEDYRNRHAQYRSDPLLHKMHAICPWFVTWDDHEFDNNYANDISEKKGIDPVEFLEQRANAYQAYYEAMPLRASALPHGPDMKLYRNASFGKLAEFMILDTRQYRTDQPNGDGRKPLNNEALKNTNSLLGRKQRGWLQSQLIRSQAIWNVLAQQVMMGMVQFPPTNSSAGQPTFSMDQWPGAAHERMSLMKFIADRRVPNPVILTGDIHSNWVNNLRVDDRQHESSVVATEFVGTSISSGGNGVDQTKDGEKLLAENPAVQFLNRQRGYVRCEVTAAKWVSDYVIVDQVTKPGGTISTRASFVVEAGIPGANKV